MSQSQAQPIIPSAEQQQQQHKTQPWRKHWPPPPADNNIMAGYRSGEVMTIDGAGGSGVYGYNDQGEGVAPPKRMIYMRSNEKRSLDGFDPERASEQQGINK